MNKKELVTRLSVAIIKRLGASRLNYGMSRSTYRPL